MLKRSIEVLRSVRPARPPKRLVVVGHGMVAHRLCASLVPEPGKNGFAITVVGEEPHPAYDRIRLSESPSPSIETLSLATPDWYAARDIELRTGVAVAKVDPERHEVVLSDGETLPYDKLVLATGSAPFIPPIPGLEKGEHVHVYRTYEDLQWLQREGEPGRTAAIIGGGLLGLETAKVLADAGTRVHVIEASSYLMPRQLDAESAAILEREIRRLGVDLHVGVRTKGVEKRNGGGMVLSFEGDMEPLAVDMILVAAGTTPRDELAREAGLKVAGKGGVIIDERLRTSDADIYAVGECVSFKGERIGLVAPGYEMADVLAANLRGDKKPRFTHVDKNCHLKLLGVPVSAAGMYDVDVGQLGVDVEKGRRTLMLDGKRLIGVTSVGEWPGLARVQDAAMRERRLTDREIARFREEGELFPDDGLSKVADWPESTVICNCQRVTRGQLSACVAGGCKDVVGLGAATGAGTTCGSCLPLLAQLCDAPSMPAATPGRSTLLWSSAAAAPLAALMFVAGPIPFADSVQSQLHEIDALFRDDLLKQWTGYIVVGITALGGLLSLRKRTRFAAKRSYGMFRSWHALAGLLAMFALLAHTGFRLGENLNMALMVTFTLACALGAATGIASALETTPSAAAATRARQLRRPLTWVHLLLFWPLPILLGLHIFSVYYF